MAKDSVHDMGDTELLDELARSKASLFDARFGLATGSLDDHSQMKKWKKQIARINTELREREIAAAEAAEGTAS
jgi:large subunit ribosomal protein L29